MTAVMTAVCWNYFPPKLGLSKSSLEAGMESSDGFYSNKSLELNLLFPLLHVICNFNSSQCIIMKHKGDGTNWKGGIRRLVAD
jgi:hypothetical protein